jgi:hypothetical protein
MREREAFPGGQDFLGVRRLIGENKTSKRQAGLAA